MTELFSRRPPAPSGNALPRDIQPRRDIVEFLEQAMPYADRTQVLAEAEGLDMFQRVLIELERDARGKALYTSDYDPLR